MAGKPSRMSKIKQLLRLHEQGKGVKTIARDLGMSKNTVKVYLEKFRSSKFKISSLLSMDDPVLESILLRYRILSSRRQNQASETHFSNIFRHYIP